MLVKRLSFKFDNKSDQYFFRDLKFEFASEKVYFIQGDNGVGKSTFFNILQGITDCKAYLDVSLLLEGITYNSCSNRLPQSFTKQVHVVQQNYDAMIADQFSFIDNLRLARVARYPNLEPLPQAKLFEIINILGIDINKPVYLLSGGQRQLLAILMALQKLTKLLLLDEPTATLDKKNSQIIIDFLFKLASELDISILIICHDKELVNEYVRGTKIVMRKLENGERILSQVERL
jgi:ABC-type lipoprotein export system ATPase subunit